MTAAQRRSLLRSVVPLLLSFAALLAAGGALAYVIVANSNRVEDIERLVADVQRSRFDATLRSCESRNDQNGGIRFIVRRAPLALRAVVAERFPVEPDCRAYARESVAVRPARTP